MYVHESEKNVAFFFCGSFVVLSCTTFDVGNVFFFSPLSAISLEKIFMWICDIKFIYCFRQQTHLHTFTARICNDSGGIATQKKWHHRMSDCWNKSIDVNEERTMLMNFRKFSAAFLLKCDPTRITVAFFVFVDSGLCLASAQCVYVARFFRSRSFVGLLLLLLQMRAHIPFGWSVYVRSTTDKFGTAIF